MCIYSEILLLWRKKTTTNKHTKAGGGCSTYSVILSDYYLCLGCMDATLLHITGRHGRIGRARPSRIDGRDFESQPIQTKLILAWRSALL